MAMLPRVPAVLRQVGLRTLSSSRGVAASAQLDGRGVIRLSGDSAVEFLQGLVTNDVTSLEHPGAPPLYAALLSAQGRVLHDLVLHRAGGESETALLADVDAYGKADLLRLLKRYRLRQPIAIDDVSEDYEVLAEFEDRGGAGGAAGGSGPTLLRDSLDGSGGAATPPRPALPADPRLAALGRRGVVARGSRFQPPPASSPPPSSPGAASTYRDLRLRLGVPEGDAEIPSGQAMPLEYGLDGLRGVAYGKGCYIGQELVARTHYKGVIRKRLFPFAVAAAASGGGPAAVSVGSEVRRAGAPRKGRGGGKVVALSEDGSFGLALLRVGEAIAAAEGTGAGLVAYPVAGGDAGPDGADPAPTPVAPSIPAWWPEEWRAPPEE